MHFLKTQLFQKAQFQKVEPNSPSVIHPNQMAKYLEKKKDVGPNVERERDQKGQAWRRSLWSLPIGPI